GHVHLHSTGPRNPNSSPGEVDVASIRCNCDSVDYRVDSYFVRKQIYLRGTYVPDRFGQRSSESWPKGRRGLRVEDPRPRRNEQAEGHHLASHRYLRSEEHTSELQSRENLVCRLLLEKKTSSNEH